jgi:hypothetical protein
MHGGSCEVPHGNCSCPADRSGRLCERRLPHVEGDTGYPFGLNFFWFVTLVSLILGGCALLGAVAYVAISNVRKSKQDEAAQDSESAFLLVGLPNDAEEQQRSDSQSRRGRGRRASAVMVDELAETEMLASMRGPKKLARGRPNYKVRLPPGPPTAEQLQPLPSRRREDDGMKRPPPDPSTQGRSARPLSEKALAAATRGPRHLARNKPSQSVLPSPPPPPPTLPPPPPPPSTATLVPRGGKKPSKSRPRRPEKSQAAAASVERRPSRPQSARSRQAISQAQQQRSLQMKALVGVGDRHASELDHQADNIGDEVVAFRGPGDELRTSNAASTHPLTAAAGSSAQQQQQPQQWARRISGGLPPPPPSSGGGGQRSKAKQMKVRPRPSAGNREPRRRPSGGGGNGGGNGGATPWGDLR